MPNRQLYDRIQQLEKAMIRQLDELAWIEKEVQQLIEENHNLAMENQHLKDRLDTLPMNSSEKNISSSSGQPMSHSLLNLEKIYDQGFHICNLYYGKRRENDENCMFCTDILYGQE